MGDERFFWYNYMAINYIYSYTARETKIAIFIVYKVPRFNSGTIGILTRVIILYHNDSPYYSIYNIVEEERESENSHAITTTI